MLDPFVGSSYNSLMLKLVEESVVGDGIKSFAEIKHQQVRSLPSIKSLGQIFYCIEQLHFAWVICSDSMLEFNEDVVTVKMVHDLAVNYNP